MALSSAFARFVASALSILCRAAAVMACDKEGDDGDEVVVLVVVVGVAIGPATFTVNHEFNPKLFKEGVQEPDANAREPVAVHDHNRSDHSLVRVVQKGPQPPPFEVDTRPGVGYERTSGVVAEEEVFLLFDRGDAGVEGDGAAGSGLPLGLSDMCVEIPRALATYTGVPVGADVGDPTSVCPIAEGLGTDPKLPCKEAGRFVAIAHFGFAEDV